MSKATKTTFSRTELTIKSTDELRRMVQMAEASVQEDFVYHIVRQVTGLSEIAITTGSPMCNRFPDLSMTTGLLYNIAMVPDVYVARAAISALAGTERNTK